MFQILHLIYSHVQVTVHINTTVELLQIWKSTGRTRVSSNDRNHPLGTVIIQTTFNGWYRYCSALVQRAGTVQQSGANIFRVKTYMEICFLKGGADLFSGDTGCSLAARPVSSLSLCRLTRSQHDRDPSWRGSPPWGTSGRMTMMKADSHDWQLHKCVRSSVRERAKSQMTQRKSCRHQARGAGIRL